MRWEMDSKSMHVATPPKKQPMTIQKVAEGWRLPAARLAASELRPTRLP